MISYSSSFLFRTKCKYCFSPPQKYETYFNLFSAPEDILKILKNSQKYRDIDLLPTNVIEQFIKLFVQNSELSSHDPYVLNLCILIY